MCMNLSNHSPGGLGLLLQFGESTPEGNRVPAWSAQWFLASGRSFSSGGPPFSEPLSAQNLSQMHGVRSAGIPASTYEPCWGSGWSRHKWHWTLYPPGWWSGWPWFRILRFTFSLVWWWPPIWSNYATDPRLKSKGLVWISGSIIQDLEKPLWTKYKKGRNENECSFRFCLFIYLNPKTLARKPWRRPFLASPAHSALLASACLTLYVL